MKNTRRTAVLAVALLAFCGSAHAEFVVDASPSPASPLPSASVSAARSPAARSPAARMPAPRIREVAAPVSPPARAEGWANDVPVTLALKQVVPSGWTVRLDKTDGRSLDENRLVSWKGGRAWPVVLSELALRGRFEATIRWSEKLVVVCPEPLAPAPALAATTLSGMGTDGSSRPRLVSPPVSRPVLASRPVVVAPTQWRLDPKRTLRENVEDWTRQAGWNRVIWEAADYPIAAAATFSGDFLSAGGPLATLISAYDTSDQPLLVELTTMDKVVHVTNRNYRPVVVEPQTAQQFDPASFRNNKAATGNK